MNGCSLMPLKHHCKKQAKYPECSKFLIRGRLQVNITVSTAFFSKMQQIIMISICTKCTLGWWGWFLLQNFKISVTKMYCFKNCWCWTIGRRGSCTRQLRFMFTTSCSWPCSNDRAIIFVPSNIIICFNQIKLTVSIILLKLGSTFIKVEKLSQRRLVKC